MHGAKIDRRHKEHGTRHKEGPREKNQEGSRRIKKIQEGSNFRV